MASGILTVVHMRWIQCLRCLLVPIYRHAHDSFTCSQDIANLHTHLSCPVLSLHCPLGSRVFPLEGAINVFVRGFFVCAHWDLQQSWTICGRLYTGLIPSVLPLACFYLSGTCASWGLPAFGKFSRTPCMRLASGELSFVGLCHEPAVQVPLVSCTCALPDLLCS